jgi:hypothetical protein
MYKNVYIIIIFILFSIHNYAQEKWSLNGYVKVMTAMQTNENSTSTFENTLHNRINFNWYINQDFTFTSGLRNRFITGSNLTKIPNYSTYLSADNGYLNLSNAWLNNSSLVGISQFDRLLVDYVKGKFQITLGRQRINWGQTFVWNPNDLFNSYSYFDFDYEEKPGSDALRVQYYLNETSKLEFSTSINKNHKITSALLFKFNSHGYDFQILSGLFEQHDYIIGGGWSGSIAGGGFNGEFTYYHPLNHKKGNLTASLHYDYTFKNSLNLQFETLYNGFGSENKDGLGGIIFMELNPKNLFPTKTAFFGSGSYDISPLFRATLAGMYAPNGSFLYLGPSVTYSLSNTLELALFEQYISMNKTITSLASKGNSVFLRLKWSY